MMSPSANSGFACRVIRWELLETQSHSWEGIVGSNDREGFSDARSDICRQRCRELVEIKH